MDPYQKLANAIILQAVKDYRYYRNKLSVQPWNIEIKDCLAEIERFFKSMWFEELTDLSGDMLLERLKAEQSTKRKYKLKVTVEVPA